MAAQAAIAIENATAFQEIAQLKDHLAEEKLYLEDEIRTERNFGEIVGDEPALRAFWTRWRPSRPPTPRS